MPMLDFYVRDATTLKSTRIFRRTTSEPVPHVGDEVVVLGADGDVGVNDYRVASIRRIYSALGEPQDVQVILERAE